MGLAAEILWSSSRTEPATRAAVEAPVMRPASLTELLTTNNEYWGALMLRVSALVIFVFQSAYFLNELNSGNLRRAKVALHLFNVGVASLAFGISLNASLVRYWRGTVLVMCWAVIGGTAAINVIRHEDVPLFIVALLFATGTGCLIPSIELKIHAIASLF